jgi:[protein-PII] uridylyltransferase
VSHIVEPLAKRLLQDLCDVGFDVGQSVRTANQACQLAAKDMKIFTSLVEARLIVGNENVFQRFERKFQQLTNRHGARFVQLIRLARREEREQFGETVYLLQPNVKRSRGGLRELHLLRWAGFARYGTADPSGLQQRGVLAPNDYQVLRAAKDFLLRVRNELHFHDNKATDVLSRRAQVRLAELYGYQERDGLLPVEQFMQDFFQHTSGVRYVVSRFVATAAARGSIAQLMAPLITQRIEEGDYRIGAGQIKATAQGLAKVQTSLAEVLRLADLANQHNVRIHHSTWEAIRSATADMSDELTPACIERFLSLLAQPARLGRILRRLHQMHVLEKVLPDFRHARGLLQFNNYHKYTVDEHSLRAVRIANELMQDESVLADVYRSIHDKQTLHLALLIHDLGKGYAEDHSEVGLRIAAATAERLRLPAAQAETLKFLVHKHLLMAHTAFRRDTSDESLVVQFAVEVGSPEVLQMLFVLTACDLAAVGPGVLTDWKLHILIDLYERSLQHLSGQTPERRHRREQDEKVLAQLADVADDEWYRAIVSQLLDGYVFATPPRAVAEQLRRLRGLAPDEVSAAGRYISGSDTTEYLVAARGKTAPGTFHRLTGALASRGLDVLSAEISTLEGGVLFDRFVVHDADFDGEPPAARIDEVCRTLCAAINQTAAVLPKARSVWKSNAELHAVVQEQLATRVKIDVNTSAQYTIVDVFAVDRPGLLYTITKKLYELDLSVAVAKIATYLDQVVDVFYVTDADGNKISDSQRLDAIRRELLEAVEEFAATAT